MACKRIRSNHYDNACSSREVAEVIQKWLTTEEIRQLRGIIKQSSLWRYFRNAGIVETLQGSKNFLKVFASTVLYLHELVAFYPVVIRQ